MCGILKLQSSGSKARESSLNQGWHLYLLLMSKLNTQGHWPGSCICCCQLFKSFLEPAFQVAGFTTKLDWVYICPLAALLIERHLVLFRMPDCSVLLLAVLWSQLCCRKYHALIIPLAQHSFRWCRLNYLTVQCGAHMGFYDIYSIWWRRC